MYQILKRLELIKISISIKEEGIINLQVIKLKKMDTDDEIKDILKQIKDKNYSLVNISIEKYIKKYITTITNENYNIDAEVQGLQLELSILEKELQELSNKKNVYSQSINEFNIQYNTHLGETIQKILELKNELYLKIMNSFEKKFQEYNVLKIEYKKIKKEKDETEEQIETLDDFDDSYDDIFIKYQNLKDKVNQIEENLNKKRKDLKKTKKDYEEDNTIKEYQDFIQEYEKVKKENILSSPDNNKLNNIYIKAINLCNLDIIDDNFQEEAQTIIQNLNDANSKKDLTSLKKILHKLENDVNFNLVSNTINDSKLR